MLVGVALDLAPGFTLGYRMSMVDTWGWANSKIRKRWFDSPARQFNLTGAHVNSNELRQLDGWFSLAPNIASELDTVGIARDMSQTTHNLKILGMG